MKIMVKVYSEDASYGVNHILCDVRDIYHDFESDRLVLVTGEKKVSVDVMYASSVKIMEEAMKTDSLDLTQYCAKYAD